MTENEKQRYMQMKQQVLPFDFWEEEKREEEKKRQEQINRLPHYDKPATDNEYLLECQWKYRHGDKDQLVKMYRKSCIVCLKFINAISNKNRHVKELTLEQKKIKAEDAATYVIEQYIKKPDFVINKNFPGYLFLRILHELYYRREVDKIINFVDFAKLYKEGTEELPDVREVIHYEYKENEEADEDQEQRELKQFNLWKKKRLIK